MLSRNAFLRGMALLPLLFKVRPVWAEKLLLKFHDERGTTLLNESLNNPNFWDGSLVTRYNNLPYDEIRLKEQDEGYVAYISGTGREVFSPEQVAEGIFRHQDMIPEFMPALKSAMYLGEGIDGKNRLEYTDIYFLADIMIFFMSVPLRTYKIQLDKERYVCAIELITEEMVSPSQWEKYQKSIQLKKDRLEDRWSFQTIVPMEYVYGFYLTEPDPEFGTRVTMITKMRFAKNANMLADIGSELPFVLRQGMQAGFIGSVHACREYLARESAIK